METEQIADPNKQARCPNCKTVHTIGPYNLRHEDGKRLAAPPDINCGCGLVLRPTVPVFRVGTPYILRQKLPTETLRT